MSEINVQLIDVMGSDLSVVNAARVSYDAQSDYEWSDEEGATNYTFGQEDGRIYLKLSDRDTKLIGFLAKHKHMSPFGHAFASFRVSAPVFVARQLVKHKFLRWNEISRRYVSYLPQFYEPYWREAPKHSKQGSGGPMEISTEAEMMFHATIRNAMTTYDLLLKEGVSPEQARSILPQNMMTTWIWSGSLDAFADMCILRCAKDTQQETQIVAKVIYAEMLKAFPVSWQALMEKNDD